MKGTNQLDMPTILDLVGNTPLVEIKKIIQKPGITVFGKLEGHNPGGSVKDRAAYGMIKGALDRGEVQPGMRLVEATSGNTGIALAMIASVFGLDITLIMPENATKERVQTMRAFGAQVILTPAEKTIEYSRQYAEELAKEPQNFMLNPICQSGQLENALPHHRTRIWNATGGKVTHFVSSMGTTGTIMGVSRFLKEKNPAIQIVGVQPVSGSRIPGIRRWSPEFLPKIFEPERVDQIIDVPKMKPLL